MNLSREQVLRLMPKPQNKIETMYSNGDTTDIINECVDTLAMSWNQTKDLAPYLKGKTDAETARNIHQFIRKFVTYKIDKKPLQDAKTPSVTLNDGFGDCKSYSILALSILENLGIKGSLKFVALGRNSQIHHVYAIINPCCCNGGKAIPIDAVLPTPNYEKPNINKYKIIPMAHIRRISGIGNVEDINSVLASELYKLRAYILRIEDVKSRDKELVLLDNVINNVNSDKLSDAIKFAFANSQMPEFYQLIMSLLANLQGGTINGIGVIPALASGALIKTAGAILPKVSEVGKKIIGDRENCGAFGKLFKTKKCKAKQTAVQQKAELQQAQVVQQTVQQPPVQPVVVPQQVVQQPQQDNTVVSRQSTAEKETTNTNTNKEPSFFEKNKTLIVVGGLGAVALYMMNKKGGGKRGKVSGLRKSKSKTKALPSGRKKTSSNKRKGSKTKKRRR